jgi:hypothetical protein
MTYFLTKDEVDGAPFLVFTDEDPRKDPEWGGSKWPVTPGVSLDEDQAVYHFPDGTERPYMCVGRDPNNPNLCKIFKNRRDLEVERYEPVPGQAGHYRTWSDWCRFRRGLTDAGRRRSDSP